MSSCRDGGCYVCMMCASVCIHLPSRVRDVRVYQWSDVRVQENVVGTRCAPLGKERKKSYWYFKKTWSMMDNAFAKLYKNTAKST